MRNLKKLLSLLMVAAMLLTVMAGCGAKTEAPAETNAPAAEGNAPAASGEKTVIRMTHPSASESDTQWMDAFEKHVEEKYPEIDLQYITIAGNELITKVTVMTQGGDWPDIITAQDIADFVTLGILEPIDDLVASSETIKLEDYYQAGLDFASYNGSLYYVPVLVVPYALLTNQHSLDAIGVKAEDIKTWDDLVSVSEKMAADGEAAYGFCGSVPRMMFRDFYIMAASNGLYANTLGDPANREKLIECVEMYKKMQPYTIENSLSIEWGDVHKYMAQDMIGFLGTGGYYAGFMSGLKADCVDYLHPIPFPVGPSAEKSTSVVGALGYALTSGSEHKDLAWKVIEEAMSPEFLYMYGVQNVPAQIEINEELLDKNLEVLYGEYAPQVKVIIQEWSKIIAEGGVLQPAVPGQTEFERSFQEHLTKVLNDEMTPEEMADSYMKAYTEIVESYK